MGSPLKYKKKTDASLHIRDAGTDFLQTRPIVCAKVLKNDLGSLYIMNFEIQARNVKIVKWNWTKSYGAFFLQIEKFIHFSDLFLVDIIIFMDGHKVENIWRVDFANGNLFESHFGVSEFNSVDKNIWIFSQ